MRAVVTDVIRPCFSFRSSKSDRHSSREEDVNLCRDSVRGFLSFQQESSPTCPRAVAVCALSVPQRTVKMNNRNHFRKGVPWPFDVAATHAGSATQPLLQRSKKMQVVASPYQPPILHMSPSRYTINVTEYARAVMYPTWNSGHFHPLVSLRMTATVDMHCIART